MWRRTEEPKAPASPEPLAPTAPTILESHRGAVSAAAGTAGRTEPTRISQSISIRGEITGREDLFFDGEAQGTIRISDATVTVGPNGRVAAQIEAREIVVEGAVRGDLLAHQRVHIRRSGSVTGEVVTPRLAIEEGAILRGSVEMPIPGETRHAAPARGEALRMPARETAAAAAAGAGAGKGTARFEPAENKDPIQ